MLRTDNADSRQRHIAHPQLTLEMQAIDNGSSGEFGPQRLAYQVAASCNGGAIGGSLASMFWLLEL